MTVLYILLWPRHSLVIPGILLVISLLLFFRNKRRLAGIVLGLLAIGCFTWYATTRWRWYALAVGNPVQVEVQSIKGEANAVVLRDPDEIMQVTRSLSKVRIQPARSYVNFKYRLIIQDASGNCIRYRVSREGLISNDLPSSAIQDVFVPQTPLPSQVLMKLE